MESAIAQGVTITGFFMTSCFHLSFMILFVLLLCKGDTQPHMMNPEIIHIEAFNFIAKSSKSHGTKIIDIVRNPPA